MHLNIVADILEELSKHQKTVGEELRYLERAAKWSTDPWLVLMNVALIKARLANNHRAKSMTRDLLDDALLAERTANTSFKSKSRNHEAEQLRRKLDKVVWLLNLETVDTLNRRGIKRKASIDE